ncbi:MAG: hypothetical protein AAFV54_03950 [Pseudomonadota bacterium]
MTPPTPGDTQTLRQQLRVDARRAVAPLALLEDLADPESQCTAHRLARRPFRRGGAPGVEPAGADRQRPAHQPDGVLRTVGGDEVELGPHCLAAH